jgi:hypothetical protein
MMESELDSRLATLHLVSHPNVTRDTHNDCLFAAYVDLIKREKKGSGWKMVTHGDNAGKIMKSFTDMEAEMDVPFSGKRLYNLLEVQEVRDLVAKAGKAYALFGGAIQDSLKVHMKHRFHAHDNEHAAGAGLNVTPLAADASDEEIVRKWAEIIQKGGTVCKAENCGIEHSYTMM